MLIKKCPCLLQALAISHQQLTQSKAVKFLIAAGQNPAISTDLSALDFASTLFILAKSVRKTETGTQKCPFF